MGTGGIGAGRDAHRLAGVMSHQLHPWADDRKVAVASYDAKDDHWALSYDEAWAADPQSFPLSPALPLVRSASGYSSSTLRRFIEHLLPEGRALDVAMAYNGLAKANVFGLIHALGSETAGALRFMADALDVAPVVDPAPREIPLPELEDRIARHENVPLTVWDSKVRMSVCTGSCVHCHLHRGRHWV